MKKKILIIDDSLVGRVALIPIFTYTLNNLYRAYFHKSNIRQFVGEISWEHNNEVQWRSVGGDCYHSILIFDMKFYYIPMLGAMGIAPYGFFETYHDKPKLTPMGSQISWTNNLINSILYKGKK